MESVAIVAVPFPSQSHLNQLLQLSLLLASRGLSVHYLAPAPHILQACTRVHGWDEEALRSIQFHPIDISTDVSLNSHHGSDTPFPTHLLPLLQTFTSEARGPLAAFLEQISVSYRRIVVLHDIMNTFAAEEAARLANGKAFALNCTAVSSSGIIPRVDAGKKLLREHGFDYIPIESCMTKEFIEYVSKHARAGQLILSGVVSNTCPALEGEFIDIVAQQLVGGGKKLFALGPLNPVLLHGSESSAGQTQHDCLDWLDKQPPASVLYVSFGTQSSLREEQVAEFASALRRSNQTFIWVLRDADGGNVFADPAESKHAKMLLEFIKETEGRGLVITGWAPQLEILAHGATAAFLSHCGWNSIVESTSHGKPILCWPMHSDQHSNAELVCKYLRVGILVRPWVKHNLVIPAGTIQEVVQKMMVSDEGMALRQRAMMLAEAVRTSVSVGGSSLRELDDFIVHMTS